MPLPTALNWSTTAATGVAWSTLTQARSDQSLYLPSLCVLLEVESEGTAGPVSSTAASAAWSGTASTVSDVLFYAFPASLVLAVVSAVLSFCVFCRLASSSHECYLATFYAAAVARLLVNVVQALPIYMLRYVDGRGENGSGGSSSSDSTSSENVLAALTSVAHHLAAVDYWLRVACTWQLVAAAVQRALSALCNCGAAKTDEEQPCSSKGDRLRGTAAAFLVCCFSLVLALPQFWMYEAAAERSDRTGTADRWSEGSNDSEGGRESLSSQQRHSPGTATNGSFACSATGELRRSASTITRDFLVYDWCAMMGRFIVPYVLLPILLPSLARGSDDERERRRQRRHQKKQQCQPSLDDEPLSSPSSLPPPPGQQAKLHEAALLRAAAREEQDFDRLLLLTALLYLLLAAPTNVLRTLVDRPLSGTAAAAVLVPLDRHLAGLIYVMADVLLNLFFAIAFVLHTLCSSSFRRVLKRLCCCCSACRRCSRAPTTRCRPVRGFDYDNDDS